MKNVFYKWFYCAALALTIGPAFAADSSYGNVATDSLTPARTLIAEKKWGSAIDELKRVNETRSANWNNLMGYSLRKGPAPELEAAERYYNEALRIEPKHRGALEYSGELYLMKGDLAKAEQRLAQLDKACFMPCEEHSNFKQAMQKFKSNGNKYVASP